MRGCCLCWGGRNKPGRLKGQSGDIFHSHSVERAVVVTLLRMHVAGQCCEAVPTDTVVEVWYATAGQWIFRCARRELGKQ